MILRDTADSKAIVGLSSGHIVTIDGYAETSQPISEADAILAIQPNENWSASIVSANIGWYSQQWLSGHPAGTKELGWFVKVETPDRTLHDYIVNASTGVLAYFGGDTTWFAHQKHYGYGTTGCIIYSSLNASEESTAGSGCQGPARTDSNVSRVWIPKVVEEVQQISTPGYYGLSGLWIYPWRWNTDPRMTPYQNYHPNPATDYFKVALAVAGSTFCAGQFPCRQNGVYYFGPGDTDVGVYAHGWLQKFKFLNTQSTGIDRAVAEGAMDLAGVAIEWGSRAKEERCPYNEFCSVTRSDYVLTAPSSSYTSDLSLPPTGNSLPRSWLGRAFRVAVSRFSVRYACELHGLCHSSPSQTLGFLDIGNELIFLDFLWIWDTAPDLLPKPTEILAAGQCS